MAMSVPKVGLARLLKEGVKHFKGVDEAVLRNIEACTELANSVRSAYGPNGMNKMVINHLGKLYVTNDAATIIKELEIQHPAAKMLILASQMQEKDIGDGTNFVIIFAGALLEYAEELIRMGLTPTEICAGYEAATKKCLEILPELCCGKVENLRDAAQVKKAVRSVLSSKQYGNEEFLGDLVVDACEKVLPKNVMNFNVDNIRICKVLGAGLHSSQVMHGMVFKRGVSGEVKAMDAAKIAVFTGPFDIMQTETKGTVLMNTAKELLNYSTGEENVIEAQVKALHDAGINCVVAGGKFGDLHVHFMNKYRMLGVHLTSKFDVRRLCKTVGATPLPNVTTPSKDELGSCSRISVEEIGGTEVVVFKQESEHGAIATIVIRGSTDGVMDDIERAIDDGVNTFKSLTKENRLLPGAGATEIELAKRIESFAQVCPGLEQYAIQKFAEALETVPKILADNAGVKSTDVLSKLYAAHQQGGVNMGFDCENETGGVRDVVATNPQVVDLFHVKHSAFKLASNAATTVLSVDQIIMSKPAGGPKARDPKGQDDED